MSPKAQKSHALRVAELDQQGPTEFEVVPGAAALKALAAALDLLELRKLRFAGRVSPLGDSDWKLRGRLGATVVQPCVATLEPVTTRIEADVERQFLANLSHPTEPEVEMSEDETVEELGEYIDLDLITQEALSLALPLYPRAEGTEEVHIQVTEPGKAAMTDDDAKPFAALAGLKQKLENSDPEE